MLYNLQDMLGFLRRSASSRRLGSSFAARMKFGLLIILILSLAYNFYALILMRRYRSKLKYLTYDVEHFVEDTNKRINAQDGLIKEAREELKSFDTDNVDSTSPPIKAAKSIGR